MSISQSNGHVEQPGIITPPRRGRAAKPPAIENPMEMQEQHFTISPPNMQTVQIEVRGTAPLMIHKFSEKARNIMIAKQEAGSTASKGKKRDPKDFNEAFENARHLSTKGWDGYPAGGIRKALIAACGLVDFQMTTAKKCIFVEADGVDATEGTPLVEIIGGKPERSTMHVRLATGVADICVRPMWTKWTMMLRIKFDADRFTSVDITNLVNRAGQQCGIGEGRPFSKRSDGIGFGTFEVVQHDEGKKAA